jgi:hypothetical protein
MSETERDLARSIAAGTAQSPTATSEFTWFALRWSGTDADGLAWREQFGEHVERPAVLTLTSQMCDRLAGLPLVFLHPPTGNLDSETFERSVVGTLAFGYVATPDGIEAPTGTELWAMCRVYDQDAIRALSSGELSTSPAVSFPPQAGNKTITLQDGSHVLREGLPDALSHLAIVTAGVWDRGAGPSGVRIDSTEGRTTMATATAEQPAQDIKDDAAGNIDRLLKHLDSKFDAMHKRMDAIEQGSKRSDLDFGSFSNHDAADPEREQWHREDAAQCARDDAEEATEREKMEKEGAAKQVAADKARAMRRDRVRARRDATQRRQDSAVLTTAQAAALRQQSADNADAQARADAVCGAWGERAPAPMSGETPLNYRVRLARHHQTHCTEPSFKALDLGALAATQPAAFDGIETKIYADSVAASANPIGPDDRLVARTRQLPGGHQVTEFFGRRTFIWHLKRPSMRGVAFLTPNSRTA